MPAVLTHLSVVWGYLHCRQPQQARDPFRMSRSREQTLLLPLPAIVHWSLSERISFLIACGYHRRFEDSISNSCRY